MFEVEGSWLTLAVLSAGLAGLHLVYPILDAYLHRREPLLMGLIGGVAVCYVILYLLPKIAGMAGGSAESVFLELDLYYVLLAAIVVYLAMIHLDSADAPLNRLAGMFDYGVHGAYSFLVGYVLVELSSASLTANLLITLVLGLHLLGMNHLLRTGHQAGFDGSVRWTLFLLLLAGTAAGLVTELPKSVMNNVTAFLAGIILVNVITEELPLRQQERLPWFVIGVSLYLASSSVILLIRLDG